jgi:hypothetical protein
VELETSGDTSGLSRVRSCTSGQSLDAAMFTRVSIAGLAAATDATATQDADHLTVGHSSLGDSFVVPRRGAIAPPLVGFENKSQSV